LWSAHEWRVRKLRINRFKPRVVDAADITAAAMADGDAEDAEGNEEAVGNGSDAEDTAGSSSDSDDDPVGVSIDYVPDSAKEHVFFVRAINRSSALVAPSGDCDARV